MREIVNVRKGAINGVVTNSNQQTIRSRLVQVSPVSQVAAKKCVHLDNVPFDTIQSPYRCSRYACGIAILCRRRRHVLSQQVTIAQQYAVIRLLIHSPRTSSQRDDISTNIGRIGIGCISCRSQSFFLHLCKQRRQCGVNRHRNRRRCRSHRLSARSGVGDGSIATCL